MFVKYVSTEYESYSSCLVWLCDEERVSLNLPYGHFNNNILLIYFETLWMLYKTLVVFAVIESFNSKKENHFQQIIALEYLQYNLIKIPTHAENHYHTHFDTSGGLTSY